MTDATPFDVTDAFKFVDSLFAEWVDRGIVAKSQHTAISAYLEERRGRCAAALREGSNLPDDVELPALTTELDDPAAMRSLGFYYFAEGELPRISEAGLLLLHQTKACQSDLAERTKAVRHRLLLRQAKGNKKEPTSPADAAPLRSDTPTAPPPPVSRRNLLEILLDPRSIQWLLGFGGALMVLGLVLLLWINKFFTPPVLAVALGIVNAAVLVAGWAILRRSRFQTAGKALTLLASLVMPLNLWYYHVNGLITLDGHLWAAALAISGLYLASALILKDETFVYIFVVGITLTGLLVLADLPPSPQKFWEITLPSTMLVVLGLLAIHTERAFPDQDGPFSRKRFGLAFFWSGHVLLAAGLLLVLGAQLAGHWLYDPWFKGLYLAWNAQPSPIVTVAELRMLALAFVLAGTYAYVYSDLVVRRVGVYVHLAAATLLWAEVLIVEQLGLELGVDAIIGVLAGTALVIHLVQATIGRASGLTRAFPVLGLLLGSLAVLLGVYVYWRALSGNLQAVWLNNPPTWSYVAAMALTAVSCRVGAHVYRHTAPKLSALYFFATGAATLVGAVALLAALGFEKWQEHAPILMLLPIVYLVAAHLYRGRPEEQPLAGVAHAAAAVLLVASLASALRGFTVVAGQPLNLTLALFFAEAAVFYGLAATLRKQPVAVHLATLMACGAVWQLLAYAGVSAEAYTLTFASVGLALLVAYRFAVLERFAANKMAQAAFQSGNTLLSLSFVAAAFMGLSHLATREVVWSFVGVSVTLTVMALAAAAIVRDAAWRRWYVVSAIGLGLLTFLAVQVLSNLSAWQKLELFCVAVGILLLVVGHVGWYREQNRHNDMVSLSLLLGSMLAGAPLAIAAIHDRWTGRFEGFYIFNEFGFLAVGVLLLVTGVLFQLRATTLCGAALTALYFLTLLIFVPWGRLNAVAVALTTGGGAIFALGLLLSVYRDRLLTLPERMRQREGVFRVLGWR